jgi:hypothetical protein
MIKIESKEEFKTTIFSVVKEDEKGETKMYLVTHQDSFDDFLMTEWDVRDEMNNLIEDEGVTSELIEYCKSQFDSVKTEYTEGEVKYSLGVDDDYEGWVDVAFQKGFEYDETKDKWYGPIVEH